MDRDSSGIWVFKMIVTHFHKLLHNIIRRCGSIDEEQIIVSDVFISEEFLVVSLFIESNYSFDVELLKNVDIFVRMMTISLIDISFLDRPHKCHKFPWDNPVEVAILDTLVLLILLDVEGFKLIPAELDGILEALQTLEHCAFVEAIAFTGISVSFE